MIIDFVCGFVLFGFAVAGWRRGFWSQLMALLGLALALAGVYFLAGPVGGLLTKLTPLQPVVAYPMAAPLVFLTVSLLMGLPVRALRRRRTGQPGEFWLALPGRLSGALLSTAHGLLFVAIILWCGLLLHRVAPTAMPDIRASFAGQLAAPFFADTVNLATGKLSNNNVLGDSAAKFARDPVGASAAVGRIAQNPKVKALARDKKLHRALARSRTVRAKDHPSLRALARDRRFVRDAQRLGLIDGDPARLSETEVLAQLSSRVAPLAHSLAALANDREVRVLLKDPELTRMLERGDPAALAQDPKFNRLVTRILGAVRDAQKPLAEQP